MNYTLEKTVDWQEVEVNGDMLRLPIEWDAVELKELCDVRDGTHESPKYVENGIPFITTKHLIDGKIDFSSAKYIKVEDHNEYIKRSKVEVGDILMGMVGTIGNPVLITEKPFDFSIKNLGLIKTLNKVNSTYLLKTLSRYLLQKTANENGGVIKFLSLTDLRNTKIVMPMPKEQTAIAHILSTQESIVSHYDTLIGLHEKRLDYLSDELLSGRIRLQGGEQGEPYTMVKNTKWKEVEVNGEMVEIPEDWEVTTLPMVCKFINGSSFKPNEWSKQGTPIIRIQNLSNPKADLNYYNGNKKGLVPLKKGDILFSWSGTIDIFEYTLEAGYLNQHIFKVESLNAPRNYIKYVLRRNISNIQVNGLTMHHITLTEIRKHQVSMSNSFLEQTAIANILTQQENLITQYKTLRDLEQKRFTWLSDALLSGTYRVKELP